MHLKTHVASEEFSFIIQHGVQLLQQYRNSFTLLPSGIGGQTVTKESVSDQFPFHPPSTFLIICQEGSTLLLCVSDRTVKANFTLVTKYDSDSGSSQQHLSHHCILDTLNVPCLLIQNRLVCPVTDSSCLSVTSIAIKNRSWKHLNFKNHIYTSAVMTRGVT